MGGVGNMIRNPSTLEMAKNIFQTEGIRGLYKGNVATFLREVPAGAMFFAGYEYSKVLLERRFGEGSGIPFLAGGIAGLFCTIASYPQDVIKTKIQLDIAGTRKYNAKWKDGGVVSCAKDIMKNEGFKGFWRGFVPGCLRAVITEAFTFLVYVEGRKVLE
jgi:solute carrier family 25 carnitine/acylcarnitine transporter 20/29